MTATHPSESETEVRAAGTFVADRAARRGHAPAVAARGQKLAAQGKLYVRDRIALLLDEGSFVEDGQLANAGRDGLPADGVVTGQGLVDGRPALVVANDPTVKAGSWGARTVEKIIRVTERALARGAADLLAHRLRRGPDHRPGRAVPGPPRRRADLPQPGRRCRARCRRSAACSGPSAAGGAYIPAFCDIVIMVEGNASMYLGSPRMAEMVVGEKVTPGGDGRRADARHGLRLR